VKRVCLLTILLLVEFSLVCGQEIDDISSYEVVFTNYHDYKREYYEVTKEYYKEPDRFLVKRKRYINRPDEIIGDIVYINFPLDIKEYVKIDSKWYYKASYIPIRTNSYSFQTGVVHPQLPIFFPYILRNDIDYFIDYLIKVLNTSGYYSPVKFTGIDISNLADVEITDDNLRIEYDPTLRRPVKIKYCTDDRCKAMHIAYNKPIDDRMFEINTNEYSLVEYGTGGYRMPGSRTSGTRFKQPTESKEINSLLYEGIRRYSDGEYVEAIEIWEKVFDLDPDNAKAKKYIKRAKYKLSR